LNVGEKDDESYLIFVSLDMGENPTMFMRQANQNGHVGNSYHVFAVFGQITHLSDKKSIKVTLYLEVENNSKFVRDKSKVRKNIEDFILSEYNMKKPDKDGWEYELTIPYEDDNELDDKIKQILQKMDSEANLKNCFIEADVTAMDGSERSW